MNDLDVGRNVDEVLRVLDALQTDELCPCNWQKGEPTLTQRLALTMSALDDARATPSRSRARHQAEPAVGAAPGSLDARAALGVARRLRPSRRATRGCGRRSSTEARDARSTPAVVEDAIAAAALMGMNNVYYRFRHMIGKRVYSREAGPAADEPHRQAGRPARSTSSSSAWR